MKPKNQHWAPQFYLRYFATPESANTAEPQVWIFSKNDGDPNLSNIKNVATKRYLYSPKGKDGTRNWDMEDRLENLESVLSKIWSALATDFIDLNSNQAIRKILALFSSTLYLRHPERILDVTNIHAHLISMYDQLPKDENGNPLITEVEYKGDIHPFDNSGYWDFKVTGPDRMRQMFVDNLKTNAIWFAEALMEKRWSIVFAEEPVFITTDTPVVVSNAKCATFGINTPGTVVYFPLSPTRVLIMDDRHDQPNGRYYPLTDRGPAPFNLTAWHFCERFMISPRQTDFVCAEMLAWADQ
jgi:hypothetical protein